jgi:hypothetical protein
LREIEEEEAAIAAQTAILAKRKAKWKAKRPVGPITVTFHDDGAEYTSKPDQATKRSSLPPLSDDEDDIEIERTLAPGVRSSPYSVDDRNA